MLPTLFLHALLATALGTALLVRRRQACHVPVRALRRAPRRR